MLKHVSASSITLFQDCNRKWYEKYVLGKKEPSSKAMKQGTDVHTVLENYLLRGEQPDKRTTAGKIASAGLQFLPAPASNLQVEIAIQDITSIKESPVAFKGYIDLLIKTDDHIEILDHKTSSNISYALTSEQLATNIQLIIYAKHVLNAYLDYDEITLTHVVYLTKSPYGSQKTSVTVSRDHVENEFSKVLQVVHQMIKAYDAPINTIEKQKNYCYAYNKRCAFYNECQTQESKSKKIMDDKLLNVLDYLRGESAEPAEVPAPVSRETTTLYIDCIPVKGATVVNVVTVLKAYIDEIKEKNQVQHIELISFMQGYTQLAVMIQDNGIPAGFTDIYIDSQSTLYSKCINELIDACNVVIK